MPGAIVAVLEHGQVIHLKGYGYANREFRIPWDPEIRYTFFSVTKPMVGTVFLRLQDQGRISLDDDIRRYLPDFPAFSAPIQIRHLLTHTSGIWQDEVLMHLVGTSVSYDPVSLRELYELIRKQPKLSSKPGTYYYYNDGGMRLAAMVLEKVSGLSFRQAMRELLFDPAEMPSADIKPWEPMYFPREAATYLMDKTLDGDINQTAIRIGTVVPETSGDGAGVGTMQDLIQFARFIGTKPDDGPTYLQRLVEPVYYRPGLYGAYRTDFAVTFHRNLRVYCHFGFYGKGMLYLPDKDMWILYMSNAQDTREPIQLTYVVDLLDAVLGSSSASTASQRADDAAFMAPPRESFTEEESRALVGTFLEPQSGYALFVTAVEEGLRFRFLGDEGSLVHDHDRPGAYRTYVGQASPLIQLFFRAVGSAPTVELLNADWEAPRQLTRIDATRGAIPPHVAQEYAGRYRSPEYGVVYDVHVVSNGELELDIGSAVRLSDRLRLEHVVGDVFETRQSQPASYLNLGGIVRFNRTAKQVTSLSYSTNDVRGLTLQRLP